MRAGQMDRRVTLQALTTVQDETGFPVETWANFATIWAGKKDIRARERFTAAQEIAIRATTYYTHWIAGVSEQMRLIDGSDTYDITGIAEIGRREGLELSCEAHNPAGSE